MKTATFAIWLALATPLAAADYPVAQPGEVAAAAKKAQPGDVITLADGTYRSTELVFEAQGTAERPIVLRAATPGKVVFSGASRLQIAGSYLVVEGFYFWNAFHPEGLVVFRHRSTQEAQHCRLTHCGVVDCNPGGEEPSSSWINIFGAHNRVDHCVIQGKTNNGATLTVWPSSDKPEPVSHQIDHNYFGTRTPLGRLTNGEAIRIIGASLSKGSRVLVEANLFDHYAGGLDVIDNRASETAFRQNTFLRSTGSLTLRAGNRCLVTDNYFIGANVASGGVRIAGEEHTVAGNYFINLVGAGETAPLVLMDGYSRPRSSSYLQAKRCTIADNILLECSGAFVIGVGDRVASRSAGNRLPPQDCTFSSNVVIGTRSVLIDLQSSAERLVWRGNVYAGGDLGFGMTPDAWVQTPVGLGTRYGLAWPQHPHARGPQLPPLQAADVGPSWFSLRN